LQQRSQNVLYRSSLIFVEDQIRVHSGPEAPVVAALLTPSPALRVDVAVAGKTARKRRNARFLEKNIRLVANVIKLFTAVSYDFS